MSNGLDRSPKLFLAQRAMFLLLVGVGVVATLVACALVDSKHTVIDEAVPHVSRPSVGHSCSMEYGFACADQGSPATWTDEVVAAAVQREFVRLFRSQRAHEAPSWLAAEVARYVRHYSSDTLFLNTLRENDKRYGHVIRQVLDGAGVPRHLYYLAVLESWLYPNAVSRAGAVGIWQFMPATAKELGLRIDGQIDERRDPVVSTTAAARYLFYLYGQFDDWALAAAAYNGGIGRVQRALERTGADSYWELVEREALPAETMAYVPKMIAIAIVVQDGRVLHDTLSTQAGRRLALAD